MISGDTIGFLYERAVHNVFRGEESSPRGMKTYEMLNVSLHLKDVTKNVLISPVRDLNYRFMVAEWLWILFGRSDVASVARFNSNMMKYTDDGVRLDGAYGPRIGAQVNHIIKTLKLDRDSRQAVISIWTPNPPASKDIPCTVSLQFLIREDKLHCIANMRSSDAWWGLPYDLFVFSQMTNYFASMLAVAPGSLYMNLGSSHLYQEHWEVAETLIASEIDYLRSPVLAGLAPTMLSHMLHGEDCGDDALIENPVWRTYGRVLCSANKQEALEHLKDGSPTD